MKHPTPEALSAFHDGIADEKARLAIEAHLNECAECREGLASLERQDRALASALTHDPGDAHFEALAAKIERQLGAKPARGFMSALGGLRSPQWAGALAALLVGAALVLLNVRHGAGPTLQNPALERRSGQAAPVPRAADETRGARPGAPAPPGREQPREDALGGAPPAAERQAQPRSIPPPTVAPAPSGAASKPGSAASRAYEVQSTPTGENVRSPRSREAFAQPPASAPGGPGVGMKPRLAAPLEENRPKVEGGEALMKYQDKALSRDEAGAAGPTSAKQRTAVQPAEPEAVQLCGAVKDGSGRPISSAMVTLVSSGSGAVSDAAGRFCIEGPRGDQTISVIAVGFVPLQLEARFAPGSPPLALTLSAVSVLGESQITSAKLRMLRGARETGAPVAAAPMPPDSLELLQTQAMRLTLEAGRAQSAPRFEAAAAEWERVRDRTVEGAGSLEARFRIAEARYHAWALAPTPKRMSAADEALTSYLVRAPLGARRDTATAWLGRVKP